MQRAILTALAASALFFGGWVTGWALDPAVDNPDKTTVPAAFELGFSFTGPCNTHGMHVYEIVDRQYVRAAGQWLYGIQPTDGPEPFVGWASEMDLQMILMLMDPNAAPLPLPVPQDD